MGYIGVYLLLLLCLFAGVVVDRPSDFYCALHGKDESGKRTISDPGVKKVAEALIGWKEKEAKGEFTAVAEKDALYQVLGKDHGGVVRGKGGIRVGKKKAFGAEYSATRATSSVNTPQDMEAMRVSIQEEIEGKVKRQFTAILEHIGVKIDLDKLDDIIGDKKGEEDPVFDKEGEKEPPTPHEVHARPPTSKFDPLTHKLEEDTPCDLLLPRANGVDGDLIVVGYGRVRLPKEAQKVHFKTREDSNFSVSVDTILGGFEDFKLPVPIVEYDILTMVHAHGTYVSWPCAWVQFSNEVLEKLKKEKVTNVNPKGVSQGNKEVSQTKGVDKENELEVQGGKKKSESKSKSVDTERRLFSKGSTSQVKPKGTSFVDEKVLESLSKHCFWLHSCVNLLPDNSPIEVDLDMSQFHYLHPDAKTWVNKGDVREFLSGEMLCVSIIHVFMSALAENLRGCESVSKVGWLCSQEMSAEHCLKNQPEVTEYVGRAIVDCIRVGDKFILAPYLQDMHWLLVVICPSNHTIYVFDSARPPEPRQLLIKTILNSKMKEISGRGLRKAVVPTWKSMVCPQQQNGLECGLYVMRFMFDLVSSCTEADDLNTVYGQSREEPFTTAEINAVRDKFATFLTDNYL